MAMVSGRSDWTGAAYGCQLRPSSVERRTARSPVRAYVVPVAASWTRRLAKPACTCLKLAPPSSERAMPMNQATSRLPWLVSITCSAWPAHSGSSHRDQRGSQLSPASRLYIGVCAYEPKTMSPLRTERYFTMPSRRPSGPYFIVQRRPPSSERNRPPSLPVAPA